MQVRVLPQDGDTLLHFSVVGSASAVLLNAVEACQLVATRMVIKVLMCCDAPAVLVNASRSAIMSQ